MTEREQTLLFEWTQSTALCALHAGYVGKRWAMTDAICLRLRGYFEAGLSPADAAEAFFATRH